MLPAGATIRGRLATYIIDSSKLEIIIDLPIGFPINKIISLDSSKG